MFSQSVQVMGMSWYREEDWNALLRLFVDAHKLHRTYAEWLAAAEGVEASAKAKGVRVERVVIEPTAFSAWCQEKGMKPNAKARMDYANDIAAKRYMGK